jgi:predicted  nucleic acid-binding Zn-ribbon protein
MWSNFRDVRSIAEKITNVVAPPAQDDDDDDEVDHDDYDDEDYSEGEDDGEYSTEEDDDTAKPSGTSPFGFVGLITRAMDVSDQRQAQEASDSDRYQKYSNDAMGEDGDNDQVELHTDEEDEVDFQPLPSNEQLHKSAFGNQPNTTIVPEPRYNNTEISNSSDVLLSGPHQTLSSTISNDLQETTVVHKRRAHIPRDDSMDDTSSILTPPTMASYESAEQEPIRLSLVRESGSVSPQRPNGKLSVDRRATVTNMSDSPPLSSRSLGSTPCGKEVLLSPLGDILYAQQKSDEEKISNATAVSTLSSKSSSVVDFSTVKFSRDALLGSFSVESQDFVEVDKAQVRINGHDEIDLHVDDEALYVGKISRNANTTNKPSSSTSRNLPTLVLHALDENEDEEERPIFNCESATEKATLKAPSANRPSSHNGDSKVLTSTTPNEQIERISFLEKRHREMQTKLDNAEMHIVELQQQASNIMEQDNTEREKMMRHFQEKEVRLLQAAADEHNQEIIVLRVEMTNQMSTLRHQLTEERKSFQNDRDKFEKIVDEYRGNLEQVESQTRDDQGKTEKAVEQIHQQHVRALRKVEDKLAHTMALLDERDDDAKRMKETMKKMESKMTANKEGAHEAEEELNELHLENETLHDQVERLQSDCAELRKTIAKLEGDSEKLVHLKVCYESRLNSLCVFSHSILIVTSFRCRWNCVC